MPEGDSSSNDDSLVFQLGSFSSGESLTPDGSNVVEGYLMASVGGAAFGPVCDDSFNARTADNVCRHLGFPSGASSYRTRKDVRTLDFVLDELVCSSTYTGEKGGDASSFCSFETSHNCFSEEGVYVVCLALELSLSGMSYHEE